MKKALKKSKHKKGANVLKRQKQTVKKAYLDYLWVTVILVVMALAVLAVALFGGDELASNQSIFYAPPVILCIAAVYTYLFLRRLLIFLRLNKISGTEMQTVEITCKRVSFITRPISKHFTAIVCIILTDENGKRYYDVPTVEMLEFVKREIREDMLNKRVALNCYANTSFVKNVTKISKP